MFYANQTIHFPDSPRHMNAGAWATGTTVAMRNAHTDMLSDGLPVIDLRHHVDDIAEGVVYLSPEEQRYKEATQFFSLVYKLPAGIYEQFGIVDKVAGDNEQANGSIFIPVPDTYILVRGRITDKSTADEPEFSAYIDRISVGTHYPDLLPYTNIYNGLDNVSQTHSVQRTAEGDIDYRQLCFGGFLNDVIGEEFPARMDANYHRCCLQTETQTYHREMTEEISPAASIRTSNEGSVMTISDVSTTPIGTCWHYFTTMSTQTSTDTYPIGTGLREVSADSLTIY